MKEHLFGRDRLIQIANEARTASTDAVQARAADVGDSVTTWLGPDDKHLSNLCNAEESLWRTQIRRHWIAIAVHGSAAAIGLFAVLVGVVTLITGRQDWLLCKTLLGMILMYWTITNARAAMSSVTGLIKERGRGWVDGAPEAMTNYGRSLIGVGSKFMFVVKNRAASSDNLPVVEVLAPGHMVPPYLTLGATLVELRTTEGSLIRNIIYHGSPEEAALAVSQISSVTCRTRNRTRRSGC